ncbi:Cof-type HAD-IIB family hydrolase [Streptococcus sp. S784/96/1]|uniref:Cof-type HAD-IIB family hydrolase n=1 Tax=Streptococcus sp. S784/96/1 TaxID=2653499 RepID=UPI001386BD20|nr:Cof-type HAD-IIB family hydrolase [Streptococcus sp. S784/96/1]
MTIIFSDIDGTLINKDLVVTPRTRKVLILAVKSGHMFVPVSARMPEAIKPLISDFLPDTPIISYNGALVQDASGKVIDSKVMTPSEAVAICRFLEEQVPDVAWNVYSGSYWFSQNRSNFWIAREEDVVSLNSTEVSLEDIENLDEVHKLLLMGEPEVIVTLEDKLKQLFPQLSIARSLPYYIEVMASGIEKGRAVTLFAQHYGIEMADTIAFGDNYNDLDMLKAVGKGFVMANGPKEVQEMIGQVTSDHNHDGIAEILEELL